MTSSNISGTEQAQAVNVALDQGTNYIAEAITEQWGERCSEYAEGCACCEAWKQYDGLLSQSAALASAREVIGDIEDYIANAQSHYATLFDRGQGIQGQPGYVVDAVWNAWTGKRLLADELSRAISDIRAAREWQGR